MSRIGPYNVPAYGLPSGGGWVGPCCRVLYVDTSRCHPLCVKRKANKDGGEYNRPLKGNYSRHHQHPAVCRRWLVSNTSGWASRGAGGQTTEITYSIPEHLLSHPASHCNPSEGAQVSVEQSPSATTRPPRPPCCSTSPPSGPRAHRHRRDRPTTRMEG